MYINKKNGYSCEQPFLCYKNKNLTNSGVRISEAWSKCGDSNSRPPVPETGALPAALHLDNAIIIISCFFGKVNSFEANLCKRFLIPHVGFERHAVSVR